MTPKKPTEYTAYALMYRAKNAEGFCVMSCMTVCEHSPLAIFQHKYQAEETKQRWKRLNPKVVKVKIVV